MGAISPSDVATFRNSLGQIANDISVTMSTTPNPSYADVAATTPPPEEETALAIKDTVTLHHDSKPEESQESQESEELEEWYKALVEAS